MPLPSVSSSGQIVWLVISPIWNITKWKREWRSKNYPGLPYGGSATLLASGKLEGRDGSWNEAGMGRGKWERKMKCEKLGEENELWKDEPEVG